MFVEFGGQKSPAFEYLRMRDMDDIENGKIEVIGPEIDKMEEGKAYPLLGQDGSVQAYLKFFTRPTQKRLNRTAWLIGQQIHTWLPGLAAAPLFWIENGSDPETISAATCVWLGRSPATMRQKMQVSVVICPFLAPTVLSHNCAGAFGGRSPFDCPATVESGRMRCWMRSPAPRSAGENPVE